MRKFQNLQQIRLNGRKVTKAEKYILSNNTWIYSETLYIDGWVKTAKTFEKHYEAQELTMY